MRAKSWCHLEPLRNLTPFVQSLYLGFLACEMEIMIHLQQETLLWIPWVNLSTVFICTVSGKQEALMGMPLFFRDLKWKYVIASSRKERIMRTFSECQLRMAGRGHKSWAEWRWGEEEQRKATKRQNIKIKNKTAHYGVTPTFFQRQD